MAITIGPIALRDFEVPAAVKYGGTHRTVVHRLGDGRRIIDRLGADDTDISFSGTLSGSDATTRARSLDRLRTTGERVTLQWDTFQLDVIVRQFSADFQSGQWIPYQVSCSVLDNSTQEAASDLSAGERSLQRDVAALASVSETWAERIALAMERPVTDLGGQVSVVEVAEVVAALVLSAEDDVLTAERNASDTSLNPLTKSVASQVRQVARAVLGRAYARRIAKSLGEG